jgi:hypothetical protein
MFFYETMRGGQRHRAPGFRAELHDGRMELQSVGITDNSAEEHQVHQPFLSADQRRFHRPLLQLAQSSGAGIVPLNIYNYAAQGTTSYQGKQLQNWDSSMWSAGCQRLRIRRLTIM